VTVDGSIVNDPVARVRDGAAIVLDLTARRQDPLAKDALVFVDPHVVVVEKPAGVSTVPFDPRGMGASIGKRARPGEEIALDERVRIAVARRGRGQSGASPALGVVHRLDKETSGLVVFTRTWAAKKALMQAFRAHTIHRRYFAIVMGAAKGGILRSNLVPDRGDGLRGSVEKRHGRQRAVGSESTQLAVTHVEVVERLPGRAAGQPCTLVSCRLETGRTHQIRIHLSESGHPVVGDRVYSRDYVRTHGNVLVPAPRLMLHAGELGFVHPTTGREMHWTSPLPNDMQEILDVLRR